VEAKQVDQIGVPHRRGDLEPANTVRGHPCIQWFDHAKPGHFLEELDDPLRLGDVLHGPNRQLQKPRRWIS
jgi:hypothetical protein